MNKTTSLGERMKDYENVTNQRLPKRMPIICRIDGKAFHTYTKNFVKPFDFNLVSVFDETCKYLAKNIPGTKLVYHQSDEISILIRNDDGLSSEAWFDNKLLKMTSVITSLVTAKFNQLMAEQGITEDLALFDCRIFVLPEGEVTNYFKWRQADAMRNSVSMVGQAHFSAKRLNGINSVGVKALLKTDAKVDYDLDIPIQYQRGTLFTKSQNELGRTVWNAVSETPNLFDDYSIVEQFAENR